MLTDKVIEKIEELLKIMHESNEFNQDNIDGASYILDALGYELLDEYNGGYVINKRQQ